ncbi:MAG: hypothetical protein U0932_04420 [Thiobacillus sp.]|nr:hypothetical protein [Thiobacillus sp.]
MSTGKPGSRPWSKWMTLMLLLATGLFVIKQLPSGYSSDLDRIGQGRNTVVLIHDKMSANTLHVMEAVDAIRGDYADDIEFLVADVNTPESAAFIRQQNVNGATILMFAADGRRLQVLHGVLSIEALRMAIKEAFQL